MLRNDVSCFARYPQVHDQEVIYKNVSIEGPNGTIRSGITDSEDNEKAQLEGYNYKGCFWDTREDRVFVLRSSGDTMTTKVTELW